MTIKRLFTKIHQDERSGPDPISMVSTLSRRVRAHNNSNGMEADHLLLTQANSISINVEGHEYFFHRQLAAPSATDEEQLTLLRRCRRAAHNQRMIDQQRLMVQHILEDNAGPKPQYPTEYEDSFHLTQGDEIGISQEIFVKGLQFIHAHETDVKQILKRDWEMSDALMIGEDLLSLQLVKELREKLVTASEIKTDGEENTLKWLKKSAAALPLESLRLYRALEIPFVIHEASDQFTGLSYTHSGSISFNKYDQIFDHRFIAAHELAHALMGHDYANNRYLIQQSNNYAVPAHISEAATEYKTRSQAIIDNDPAIRREWNAKMGSRSQLFDDIRDVLIKLQDAHQSNDNQTAYEGRGHSWDYELVCNYFALRQANFASEPEAMHFLSPKSAALCDELEKNSQLQQEQLREINRYYDNPQRDALFALIQKDYPTITLPQGRSKA